jgi:hypothetical protein
MPSEGLFPANVCIQHTSSPTPRLNVNPLVRVYPPHFLIQLTIHYFRACTLLPHARTIIQPRHRPRHHAHSSHPVLPLDAVYPYAELSETPAPAQLKLLHPAYARIVIEGIDYDQGQLCMCSWYGPHLSATRQRNL